MLRFAPFGRMLPVGALVLSLAACAPGMAVDDPDGGKLPSDGAPGADAISPDAAIPVPVAVEWTNLIGTVVSGPTLTKVGGVTLTWDAGATSVQSLDTRGGWVEFTVTQTDVQRAIGLSHGNTDASYTDIDYALILDVATKPIPMAIYEGGVQRYQTTGTYEIGDVFRVTATGSVVTYSKNGVVFDTSITAPTYPLLVDCSLSTIGAELTGVTLTSAP